MPSPAPTELKFHCRMCRRLGTTRAVTIRQTMPGRIKTIEGELCRSCIRKYSLKYAAFTLVAGWWGPMSFLRTPVFIVGNFFEFCGTIGMKD